MPPNYPGQYISLRVGGHFGSSSSARDQWSTGLKFSNPFDFVTYDRTKLTTFVTEALNAFKVFHANINSGVGSTCFLDWATGARCGTNGKYDPATQDTVRVDIASLAGGGSVDKPWNTALVHSLRTAKPRGYASNGRVYYPMLGGTLDATTGRMASNGVELRHQGFKTLLDTLNTLANAYDPGTRLIVASGVGLGEFQVVTATRCDERLDSIERRENDQIPVWHSANLA